MGLQRTQNQAVARFCTPPQLSGFYTLKCPQNKKERNLPAARLDPFYADVHGLFERVHSISQSCLNMYFLDPDFYLLFMEHSVGPVFCGLSSKKPCSKLINSNPDLVGSFP